MRYSVEVLIVRTIEFEANDQDAADLWVEEFMVSPDENGPKAAEILIWRENEAYHQPRPVSDPPSNV